MNQFEHSENVIKFPAKSLRTNVPDVFPLGRSGEIFCFPNTVADIEHEAAIEARRLGEKIDYDAQAAAEQFTLISAIEDVEERGQARMEFMSSVYSDWEFIALQQPVSVLAVGYSENIGKDKFYLVGYEGLFEAITYRKLKKNWDELWNTDTDTPDIIMDTAGPVLELRANKIYRNGSWEAYQPDMSSVDIPFSEIIGIYAPGL